MASRRFLMSIGDLYTPKPASFQCASSKVVDCNINHSFHTSATFIPAKGRVRRNATDLRGVILTLNQP